MEVEMPFEDIYQPPDEDFLFQGDIFRRKLIGLDIKNPTTIRGYILLNASCDLVRDGKVDFFSLAPIRPLRYYVEKNKENSNLANNLDNICKYNTQKAFFLPPTELFGGNKPHYAELGYIIPIPIGNKYKKTCENMKKFREIAIRSPWSEKLGEMVGNYFSRVGVPEIKNKKTYTPWKKELMKFDKFEYVHF
jgi:hypothetical protein